MVVNVVGLILALLIIVLGFVTSMTTYTETNKKGKFIAGFIAMAIGSGILSAVMCNLCK